MEEQISIDIRKTILASNQAIIRKSEISLSTSGDVEIGLSRLLP